MLNLLPALRCFLSLANSAKVLTLFLSSLFSLNIGAQPAPTLETCQIATNRPNQTTHVLLKNQAQYLMLPQGESQLRLSCRLKEQAVFSFGRDEIMGIRWTAEQVNITQLSASSPSYLLPAGQFTIDFHFTTHHPYNQQFSWKSLDTFLNDSLINNMTMAAFYGLCLTLILYVFFMGRVVGDNRFQLYSLYVFCAATFFLLQEGQLNILLPEQSFLLSHQFYLLFAGLTVFTATIFIVRLTDLYKAWPRLTRLGLELGASAVLMISLLMLVLEHGPLSAWLGSAMAQLTLLIMLVIFVLVSIQAKRNMQSAKIVLLSLALMVVAMVFRTVLNHIDPFLHRYALIIAFAVEALMLAVAVSARIKNIKQDKLAAQSLANTDVLCQVLNRRGWEAKALDVLNQQRKENAITCLLYIDLNNFKQINDNYGHDMGDKVLKVVAEIIRHQLRSKDCIGRIGGDEFVALGYFDNHTEAENLALRMQQRLSDFSLHATHKITLNVSASVGYVIFDQAPNSVEDMLIQADQAMYKIKKASKQPELALVD